MAHTVVWQDVVPHPNEVFIGSEWVAPSSQDRAAVVSPFTGESIAQLPEPSVADADAAVKAAAAAFTGPWRTMSVHERLEHLRKFRDVIERRSDELDQAWSAEVGVPISIARSFDGLTLMSIDDNLQLAETAPLVEERDTPAGHVTLYREPLGPVLAILTYNGPVIETAMAVVPALAVGNPVIIKLPPENRMVGHVLADCFAEAGLPAGVISVMTAGVEVSKHLVAHEDIAAVHFTGGTEIGADVAAVCGSRIVPVILELGGKAAGILTEDTDLEAVLPTLLGGMTTFQGQLCIATTRILVPRQRQDEVVKLLAAGLQDVVMGDPAEATTTYGPMPSERVRDRAEGYIARAVAAGARVASGGERPGAFARGFFLEPTLLVDVTPDMEVAQNEIFGPVYCVIPYDDIDEAIRITNGTQYGLASSIYTNDKELAQRVAREVEVGAFGVNGGFPCLTSPYGGFKKSGVGRTCGIEGLLSLTRIKSVIDYSA